MVILAAVLVMVVIYDTDGNYTEKTEVYNTVLKMEQLCEDDYGIYNHLTLTCMYMGGE